MPQFRPPIGKGSKPAVPGDYVWTGVIFNSILFLACVLAHQFGKIKVLSPAYARDGFCISNLDKSVYYQSHALSFYCDMFFCAVMWTLVKVGSKSNCSIAVLKKIIPGHFMHGVAHMFLAH